MAATTDELSLRAQLVAHYKEVAALVVNEGSSGNLSVRFGTGMLISPNGAKAESLAAADIVETAWDGTYSGGRLPSSEWRLHAAIYQRQPDAAAVVHTHSDHCVAVASHGGALPGFHYLVGVFGGGDVPCVPSSTFGSQELADGAADALAERTACLLGNHGMIARGPSLAHAVSQAHGLEIMCRVYVLARQLGEPRRLTDREWQDFRRKAEEMAYAGNGDPLAASGKGRSRDCPTHLETPDDEHLASSPPAVHRGDAWVGVLSYPHRSTKSTGRKCLFRERAT